MKASQSQLSSLLITIVLVIGALFLFGIGLLMGFAALLSLSSGKGVQAGSTIFLVAFSFEGLVLLAAAFFVFQKYLQKPAADQRVSIPISSWLIAAFVTITGGSIAIGYVVNNTTQTLDWLVLPLLTIPAVVLPLIVLLAFGTRNLPFGTRAQTWSVLGLAMTLGPVLLFTLEIFVAIVIFLGVIAYVAAHPELASRLQALSQQIMNIGPRSGAVLDLLAPFFTKPGVIVTALVYIAVLVPALEELFKPLGVWLFAGKLESQAQGFALGALSGAGYALIETFGVSGQTGDWTSLLFSRIGTGLLHVTTSALMGAAIVLAWRERRYWRLLGTYLLAILLHGSWNALAILFTFSNLAQTLGQGGRLSMIQPVMLGAMVALAIGLFVILVVTNHRMQRTVASPPAQIAPPAESM